MNYSKSPEDSINYCSMGFVVFNKILAVSISIKIVHNNMNIKTFFGRLMICRKGGKVCLENLLYICY